MLQNAPLAQGEARCNHVRDVRAPEAETAVIGASSLIEGHRRRAAKFYRNLLKHQGWHTQGPDIVQRLTHQEAREVAAGVIQTLIWERRKKQRMLTAKETHMRANGECGEWVLLNAMRSLGKLLEREGKDAPEILTDTTIDFPTHTLDVRGRRAFLYEHGTDDAEENDLAILLGDSLILFDTTTSLSALHDKLNEDRGIFSRFHAALGADTEHATYVSKCHVLLSRNTEGYWDMEGRHGSEKMSRIFGHLPPMPGCSILGVRAGEAVSTLGASIVQKLINKGVLMPFSSGLDRNDIVGLAVVRGPERKNS
ncbi:MAG: hypothetical protein G01um101425_306 [Candidatus Peregrinibacteria bacterium Gr01-1014_25]|nr:MAG: hypothetical protein G01um101425_306 [Candidatus Peregrinibacteria bacterium Gr01-1014_25]